MHVEDYCRKLFAWSFKTFGPKQDLKSITDHIREEINEVETSDGKDIEEWVDIIMLAMDGAHRHAKATPEQLADALHRKYNICVGRKWPDWRTLPLGVLAKHIKEE